MKKCVCVYIYTHKHTQLNYFAVQQKLTNIVNQLYLNKLKKRMKIYSLALRTFNLDKKIQICDVSNIGIYIGIWHSFCIYMCVVNICACAIREDYARC